MSAQPVLRYLSREESVALLGATGVGRVGVTRDGVSHVVPVNYAVYGDSLVFRCGTGTKLAAAAAGRPMAFEVDQIDESTGTGWSVLVSGSSRVVDDEETLAAVEVLGLRCFDPSGKHAVVQIQALLVSGREIRA